jgi:hypothetical protein
MTDKLSIKAAGKKSAKETGRSDHSAKTPPVAGWRFHLGVALFAVSLLGPLLLIPFVASLDFSGATIASISSFILIGAEILLLAAAAIMGKDGYAYLKSTALGFLKRYGPPQRVGRARYWFGLALFVAPILFGLLSPYLAPFIPGYQGNEIGFALAGDGLLLASLFVLGGDFWDKLRALFIHDAKAVMP